ncbi:response regulator [Neptuniibacter sp. QD48_11]|uniref:response regulator n=1 Tax=Neptuniibacter sp. QD48_11 TaxID=3398211 RepID=UPI0039F4A303
MSQPVPVVICDDSRLARKQMASALRGWNVEVTFAEHGLEGLEAIRAGKGDILFLDLTMPIMDGYQALERIRQDDLPTMVIVVSGDIQPEAQSRVEELGALAFIKKPTSPEVISEVLQRFGLLSELEHPVIVEEQIDTPLALPEYYQEIANVAMGQAGSMLGSLLKTFVHLPIPVVKMVATSELANQLKIASDNQHELISQGFIGSGVAGEALLLLQTGNLDRVARLMGMTENGEYSESDLLMSLANALIGAFISGFAQQLDLVFSRATPSILHDVERVCDQVGSLGQTMTISVDYQLPEYDFQCELILAFTPDSLPVLQKIASYFE